MPKRPAITVIISTYNDLAHVEKKLREVHDQTIFEESEFLFIETGSEEKERNALKPFCEAHLNCRLISRDERLSLYEAWNLGWSEARAPLVCISNMDDCMHPRLLEYVVKSMAKEDWEICTVLTAKQSLTDPSYGSWEIKRLKKLELQPRPGAFFAWRKELSDSLGQFDTEYKIAADKDFWARATAQGCIIGLVPKLLNLYSQHSDQLSTSQHYRKHKLADRKYARTKPYPHIWPPKLISKVRRINRFRKWIMPKHSRHYIEPS